MAMDRRLVKIFMTLIFLSLGGCSEYVFTPHRPSAHGDYWKPSKAQQHVADKSLFFIPRESLKMKQHVYRTQNYPNYQSSFLSFHSIGVNGQKNNEVTAIYSRSKLPGRRPLFVILPIWGGPKYPPKAVEQAVMRFSRGKINVLRTLGERPAENIEELQESRTPQEFYRLLEVLVARTRYTIVDTEQIINWALKQGDVDPRNVIIIGFSRGVFVAGLLTQIDPKITGAIFVMGGATPSDILYSCNFYNVRKKITQRFHWSNEKFRSIIQQYLAPFDIANYPTRLDPSRVLIFDSAYDTCIPEKAREDLWLTMGKPDRISLLYDHVAAFYSLTILGGYFMRHIIQDFVSQPKFSTQPSTKS